MATVRLSDDVGDGPGDGGLDRGGGGVRIGHDQSGASDRDGCAGLVLQFRGGAVVDELAGARSDDGADGSRREQRWREQADHEADGAQACGAFADEVVGLFDR